MKLNEILSGIKPLSGDIEQAARSKIDNKTKPPGSLGRLEDIAIQMSLIQNSLTPVIDKKGMFVFAGDHGIAQEGVSAFPSEVTPQMVLNFVNGGAAINVLCRYQNIGITVVDMGVNYDFDTPGVIDKKIRKGTRNFLKEPAMTEEEAISSILNGFDVISEEFETKGTQIIGLGDMGIGNTTPSSAIISTITGISPEHTAGRGTGVDDAGLKRKVDTLTQALEIHKPDTSNALDILQKIGGYEIGGITGAVLACAYHQKPVVLDGIISTAGGLLAFVLCPAIQGYIFSAHQSVESGQKYALKHMNLEPLLDLNMRLGEGTGAALAMNIIEASCRIMDEMASFEEAGVSNKE